MHELAVTQSMFDLVMKEFKKVNATKVGRINIVVGEMTGIVGDSVQFYFNFLSEGTPAEGALVSVKKKPPKARCRKCGKSFKLENFNWTCSKCQGDELEITGGNELYLESIEVD
jgi:hydrogenase nickel incorporation protein HypA/HybF